MTTPRNDGPNGLFPYPLDQMFSERRAITTMLGTTLNEMGYQKLESINATSSTVENMCDSIVRSKGYSKKRKIIRECQNHYVTNADPNRYNGSSIPYWAEQATTLSEDLAYFGPCFNDASTLRSAGSRVYLYSFDYVRQGLEDVAPWHAQDVPYIMGYPHHPAFDKRDYEISDRYVSLYVNFIKFGNPTPEPLDNVTWETLKKPFGFNYLSIDLPVTMKPDYHQDGVLFWNYKVPLMENGISFDNVMKKYNEKGVKEEASSSSKWKYAFWTVFVMLIGVICAIGGISAHMYYKRKNAKRNTEEQSLLSVGQFDNYNSL
jgi:carboxylesterase type B